MLPGAVPSASPGDIGPYSPNLPAQQTAITRKYAAIADQLRALPSAQVSALIDLDSSRVAKGQAPLAYKKPTDPTWSVLQTSLTNTPATPVADRSVYNVPGNALHDLTDIVRSIPRLPQALLSIPSHPERALTLIPGVSTVQHLGQGVSGIKDLLTHPLNTFLDVLPGVSKLAELTPVAKLADETAMASREAAIAGLPAPSVLQGTTRPLSAVLFNRVLEDGALGRSALGELGDFTRNETKVGQAWDTFFGPRSRDIARAVNTSQQKLHGMASGRLPADELGLATIAKDSHDFWNEFPSIPPERRLELHQAITNGDPTALNAIQDPHELAAISRYRDDLLPRMTAIQTSLGDIGSFNSEQYAASDYHALASHHTAIQNARRLSDLKQAIADPSSVDTASIVDQLQQTLAAPGFTAGARDPASLTRQAATGAISAGQRSAEVRSLIRILDAKGFDTTALSEQLRAGTLDPATLTPAALTTAPRYARSDLIDVFDRYGRAGDLQADRMAQALRQGPGPALTRALDNLLSRTGPSQLPEMADPIFADSIRRLRTESRFMNTAAMRNAGPTAVARAERNLESLKQSTVPARFTPLVNTLTGERFTSRVLETLHPTSVEQEAQLTQAIIEKRWGAIPGYTPEELTKLYRDTQSEIASTWQQLRDNGYDPVFVHAVDPRAVGGVINPTLSEVPTTITSARKRALDSTGGVQDWSVALHHQAMEYLSRSVSEDVISHISQRWGTSEASLREALAPEVRAYMERNPLVPIDDAFNAVAGRSMRLFNPTELGYNWGGTKLQALSQDRVWIPKSIYTNLKQIHDPKTLLGGVMDPATRVFRISVTGLSPRLHLYNILGGATMLLGEAGPGAFKYMGQARAIMRDPEVLAQLARTDPEIATALGGHAQFFKDLDLSRPGSTDALLAMAHKPESAIAARQYLFGRTLKRVWDEMQQNRALGKFRDATGNIITKSYDLNGMFDDMYRGAAYLQGKAKATAAGLSEDAQRAAGMEMARRSLMDYASMTPMERTVIRSVFPFYSFTRHAIGYVLRYPFDHPLRAAVISALGQAEVADANDTLPSRLLGSVFLGHQDAKGHQTALNMTPVNPFGDVANMLTLQGFIGGANPIINTVLDAIGVNRGQAELYPSLRYDPDTGRMTAVHPNPLVAFAQNTVPQSQILTSLLGLNSDFSRQVHTDPTGALRSLVSAAGLPIIWRQYNVPLEQYKAELAREDSSKQALANAQQTGDWSEALRYPSIRPTFDAVAAAVQQNPALAQAYQIGPQVRSDLINKLTARVAPGASRADQGGAVGSVSRGI